MGRKWKRGKLSVKSNKKKIRGESENSEIAQQQLDSLSRIPSMYFWCERVWSARSSYFQFSPLVCFDLARALLISTMWAPSRRHAVSSNVTLKKDPHQRRKQRSLNFGTQRIYSTYSNAVTCFTGMCTRVQAFAAEWSTNNLYSLFCILSTQLLYTHTHTCTRMLYCFIRVQ